MAKAWAHTVLLNALWGTTSFAILFFGYLAFKPLLVDPEYGAFPYLYLLESILVGLIKTYEIHLYKHISLNIRVAN